MPRNSLTRYTARHLRIKRLVQFIFADPVYYNALTNCAALLCRALRRVNRLCSRTVSDTANRLRKTRKKKSSAVPHFEAVTCRKSAPDSPMERGDSQEGGNRRCLPSCAPARRQRNSPLRFSEKLPAHQGRTRLRQFECPGQPIQKRSRPVRANTPAAIRVPRSAGAEKTAAQIGAKSRRLLTVYPLYFPVRLDTIGL